MNESMAATLATLFICLQFLKQPYFGDKIITNTDRPNVR